MTGTFTLTDYNIYTVNGKAIADVDINLRLVDLNYATFVSSIYIATGTEVTIKFQDINEVFKGKVTQCRKLARTVDNITRYDIEVVELAAELQNMYITSTTKTGIYINNTSKEKKLGQYVSYIIDGSGWGDSSDSTYRYKDIVEGGASDDSIPSMGFSNTTIYTALQRLIVSIFNYGLWFDYPSGQKMVRYGPSNRTIAAGTYPAPINITMLENSNNYNVDGVVVYGADNSMVEHLGDISRDKKVVMYRYADCNSQTELRWVCRKVYDERSVPSMRYEIEFPAGYYTIHEGDVIHIYDESVGLPYNADGYGVKDVRIRNDKTTVGIGTSKLTIFDILNDRLSVIDGDFLSATPTSIDTAFGNVYANQVDPAAWGEESLAQISIGGTTFLGDLFMWPEFAGLGQSESSGYYRVYSAVGSIASLTATNTPVSISCGGPYASPGYAPVLESSWFPWSWQWVELELRFVSDANNVTDSGCSWTCEWPGITLDDSGAGMYATYPYTPIIMRWHIGGLDNVPFSYPIFTFQHTGDGTEFIMHDVVISLRVFYYPTSNPDISGTLTSGTVQMQIRNANNATMMNWITIYDTTSPTTYVGKKYDLEDYISYSSVVPGTYYIAFRCKGDHPTADYVGVGVRVTGQYASFEEDTEVIP
jgi:hypothetical protein